MKKIAGYYRLSMEDDEVKTESNSITNQRLLIKKYVLQDEELSKYEYCEFYDDGYSGTTMNRPGMQAMLEKIKDNEIQAVIVKDISRFSRDYIKLGTYMEQIFPFMGIRFIAITDHYDSKKCVSRTVDMDIAFKSLLADFYCKDISEKVKSSLEAKRKQGKYSTGLTPFGYAKDKEDPYKLVLVPEEAEVVRYIFQLSTEGNNLTQICKRLNDEGVMTPLEYKNLRKKQKRKELMCSTKFWQAGTVRTILMNESYIGNMVYEKTEQSAVGSGKKIVKPRAEWKVFENHHIPIVDKDMFASAQMNLGKRKITERKSIEYPLKGKVFCGCCKRKLKIMKLAGEKIFFYCCYEKISSHVGCMSGSFSNEILEKIVLSEIRRQLLFLTDMEVAWQKEREILSKRIKEQERHLVVLEKKQQELTEQKVACLEEYHAGNLNKEQFFEKRTEIMVLIQEIKAEYERKNREKEKQIRSLNELVGNSRGLLGYPNMKHLTREIVESFVDHIEIDGNQQIDIHWAFNDQLNSDRNNIAVV